MLWKVLENYPSVITKSTNVEQCDKTAANWNIYDVQNIVFYDEMLNVKMYVKCKIKQTVL